MILKQILCYILQSPKAATCSVDVIDGMTFREDREGEGGTSADVEGVPIIPLTSCLCRLQANLPITENELKMRNVTKAGEFSSKQVCYVIYN